MYQDVHLKFREVGSALLTKWPSYYDEAAVILVSLPPSLCPVGAHPRIPGKNMMMMMIGYFGPFSFHVHV